MPAMKTENEAESYSTEGDKKNAQSDIASLRPPMNWPNKSLSLSYGRSYPTNCRSFSSSETALAGQFALSVRFAVKVAFFNS